MAKRPEGYGEDIESPGVAVARKVSQKMTNREKYNYSDRRGTPQQHCGPDHAGWWPADGECSMFRDPHRCTLVGGMIATRGKCDAWDPKNK